MEKKMYKVLFADDEYWTREKIRRMIDWQSYSLDFLLPAKDGREVLKRVRTEQPDILITDINMPFLGGVELLQILSEECPDLVTFVISGYDDFEYVRGTFVAGSINYLIKPVTRMDLVKTLSQALGILADREEEEEKRAKEQLALRRASSMLQDREYSLLLEREGLPQIPSITLSGGMALAGCSLVLIKLHNLKALMRTYGYDMNHLSLSVKKDIKDRIPLEQLIIFNHIYRSNEFILISEGEGEQLEEYARALLDWLPKRTGSVVTVVLSEPSFTMDSIHEAYVQAVAMMMTRRYHRESVFLKCREGAFKAPVSSGRILTKEGEKAVRTWVQRENQEALLHYLAADLSLTGWGSGEWSFLEVRQAVRKILNIFMDAQAESGTPAGIGELENMMDMADKSIESLDPEELWIIIKEAAAAAISEVREAKDTPDTVRSAVKQAAAYIETNYFEELTLGYLAGQFAVEASYFSRMFRQVTGDSLMYYIAKVRIRKAQEQMQNQEVNLTEIAFLVGYEDYTYFGRVFRKMTGMSPSEYRNSIRGGRQ